MSESLTGTCQCGTNPGGPAIWSGHCVVCGKKVAEEKPIGATIPDERRKFAERLIKHHKRIIHEIEQEYGIGQ